MEEAFGKVLEKERRDICHTHSELNINILIANITKLSIFI